MRRSGPDGSDGYVVRLGTRSYGRLSPPELSLLAVLSLIAAAIVGLPFLLTLRWWLPAVLAALALPTLLAYLYVEHWLRSRLYFRVKRDTMVAWRGTRLLRLWILRFPRKREIRVVERWAQGASLVALHSGPQRVHFGWRYGWEVPVYPRELEYWRRWATGQGWRVSELVESNLAESRARSRESGYQRIELPEGEWTVLPFVPSEYQPFEMFVAGADPGGFGVDERQDWVEQDDESSPSIVTSTPASDVHRVRARVDVTAQPGEAVEFGGPAERAFFYNDLTHEDLVEVLLPVPVRKVVIREDGKGNIDLCFVAER